MKDFKQRRLLIGRRATDRPPEALKARRGRRVRVRDSCHLGPMTSWILTFMLQLNFKRCETFNAVVNLNTDEHVQKLDHYPPSDVTSSLWGRVKNGATESLCSL